MIKIGTAIAIPLAIGAGVYLAVSYANGDIKGIFIAIGLYVAAAWLHYVSTSSYYRSDNQEGEN